MKLEILASLPLFLPVVGQNCSYGPLDVSLSHHISPQRTRGRFPHWKERRILILSNSDTFQFRHYPILTFSNSDIFQFWYFPILTFSKYSETFQFCIKINYDTFQGWHFPVPYSVGFFFGPSFHLKRISWTIQLFSSNQKYLSRQTFRIL